VWGDRAVGGVFEDVYVLLLVVVGMGVFLASLVGAYVGYAAFQEDLAFQRDADAFLAAFLSFEPVLHEGRRGLFDAERLANLTLERVRAELRTPYAFRLLAVDVQGTFSWELATGEPAEVRRAATTSANLWVGEGDVRGLRVTAVLWRA
jgi:hypothetical protein